jgi:hypothetical protein
MITGACFNILTYKVRDLVKDQFLLNIGIVKWLVGVPYMFEILEN